MSALPKKPRQSIRSNANRLLLVLSLLLAQTGALLHAQDHALAPGSNICDSCLFTQSLDSGLTPAGHCQLPETDPLGYFHGLDHVTESTPTAHTYLSRAPPAA